MMFSTDPHPDLKYLAVNYPEQEVQGFLARVWRAWDRFWFTPADPTLLGLIRIGCGALALYTVLVYTFDLQTFFGPTAWVNLELRRKLVAEMPSVIGPLNSPEAPGTPPGPAAKPTTRAELEYIERYRKHWGDGSAGSVPGLGGRGAPDQ